jgi:hypothetical protein
MLGPLVDQHNIEAGLREVCADRGAVGPGPEYRYPFLAAHVVISPPLQHLGELSSDPLDFTTDVLGDVSRLQMCRQHVPRVGLNLKLA